MAVKPPLVDDWFGGYRGGIFDTELTKSYDFVFGYGVHPSNFYAMWKMMITYESLGVPYFQANPDSLWKYVGIGYPPKTML